MALPELTQQPIQYVEATPDGGYALRILQAYRANCDCRYKVEGDVDSELWDATNEHQEQRAAELDKAIELLREDAMPESLADYAGFCGPEPEPAAVLTHVFPPVAERPFTLIEE